MLALDTETTGTDPKEDRIVDIAIVEITQSATRRVFQSYVNPERDIPEDATAIHGITNDMVADKPLFSEIIPQLMDFIGSEGLVIHNAPFDIGFLDEEFRRAGLVWPTDLEVVDTLKMAQKLFPGSRVSLDALCGRFNVDKSARTLHGALVDATLLSDVYMRWQSQAALDLSSSSISAAIEDVGDPVPLNALGLRFDASLVANLPKRWGNWING